MFPAKLQCTYTFGLFCHECYARKHVKVLPKYLDLKPVVIDYSRPGGLGGFGAKTIVHKPLIKGSGHQLGDHWHTFFDLRGCPYYYNFITREAMRRQESAVTPDNQLLWTMTEEKERVLVNLAQAKESLKLTKFSQKKPHVFQTAEEVAEKAANSPKGRKDARRATQVLGRQPSPQKSGQVDGVLPDASSSSSRIASAAA